MPCISLIDLFFWHFFCLIYFATKPFNLLKVTFLFKEIENV